MFKRVYKHLYSEQEYEKERKSLNATAKLLEESRQNLFALSEIESQLESEVELLKMELEQAILKQNELMKENKNLADNEGINANILRESQALHRELYETEKNLETRIYQLKTELDKSARQNRELSQYNRQLATDLEIKIMEMKKLKAYINTPFGGQAKMNHDEVLSKV